MFYTSVHLSFQHSEDSLVSHKVVMIGPYADILFVVSLVLSFIYMHSDNPVCFSLDDVLSYRSG